MRSLIVYTLVILGGAIVYKAAARAEKWVDSKGDTAVAAKTHGPSNITGVTLQLYGRKKDPNDGSLGPVELLRTVTVTPTRIDIGEKQETLEREFARIQGAAEGVAERKRAPGLPMDIPRAGGDVLTVENAKTGTWHVITSGWEAGPVDAVKDAIWEVVRKRWKPAYKRRPATEFVEPFQELRTQLRIRF